VALSEIHRRETERGREKTEAAEAEEEGQEMTRILTELITQNIDNDRWVRLVQPFVFESDVLKEVGLKWRVEIPTNFIQDFESVPITRGRNKRGGTVHDYLSCEDSDPLVTKQIAAACYFEMNEYCDSIDAGRNGYVMVKDWARRWSKWAVVRVWPGYFHKRKVLATCQEIVGIEGDPYVTIEKLEAAIVQSEQATDAIKDVPSAVEGKPAMVEASEKVTTDLKDAKQEAEEKK
jgi:hypothetical protein